MNNLNLKIEYTYKIYHRVFKEEVVLESLGAITSIKAKEGGGGNFIILKLTLDILELQMKSKKKGLVNFKLVIDILSCG